MPYLLLIVAILFLQVGYIGDYMGDYYRCYYGGH